MLTYFYYCSYYCSFLAYPLTSYFVRQPIKLQHLNAPKSAAHTLHPAIPKIPEQRDTRARKIYPSMNDACAEPHRDSSGRATIILDAKTWKSKDDFYTSFFAAVHAPLWHGRNLDALNDSVCAGAINGIEKPYSIIIKNYGEMDELSKDMADRFVTFFRDDLDTPVHIIEDDMVPMEGSES